MNTSDARYLINQHLIKTMGCTDIGVIGYVGALAASFVSEAQLTSLTLTLSDSLYKNSVHVGVPGMATPGLEKALALGYILKNEEKKLSVFEHALDSDLMKVEAFVATYPITIKRKSTKKALYLHLAIKDTLDNVYEIEIADHYENVKSIKKNHEAISSNAHKKAVKNAEGFKIKDMDEVLAFVRQNDFSGLEPLFEVAHEQYQNARNEIKKSKENYLAEDLKDNQRACLYDISNYLRKHIALPSKKRMRGDMYPVYGVAGSGNLGIGSLIAPKFLAHVKDVSQDHEHQLIVLSFLTSVYVKQKMNVVTAVCGTGHATGCAVAAITAFYKAGSDSQIKNAMNLYLASSMGYLCDGAKMTCTHKVSFAGMNGIIAGKMAVEHDEDMANYGLNKVDIEASLENLAILNNTLLKEANKGIIPLL